MSETTDFADRQIDQNKLLTHLSDNFNESELRALCFELHIDFEDLLPGSKPDKARELVLRCERERRLPELAEAILRARPHIPQHSLIRDTRTDKSPFKGLPAFQEGDEALFYGRETLTADLLQRLIHPANLQPTTFLALVGASGCGKSSVVRAGLIPALRRQTNWPIHIITPTTHPLETLAVTLTKESESVTAASTGSVLAITTLMDDLRRDPRSLHLYVRRLLASSPSSARLILFIDQFEELFTLCRDEAEKQAFVDNLVTAVQPDTAGQTVVIITLRADFYSHCLQFESLHHLLEQQQKIVPAMTVTELREAIEHPASRAGLIFEAGLVDLLLRDLGATGSQAPEPGALPLLSHALLETWQRREGDRLALAGYTAAGGVHGAIAKTAESTYQHLTPAQQMIARNIFMRLTELGEGTQDTRRRAGLDELLLRTSANTEAKTVLKLLTDARLVTTHEDAAEVAHEALIREWSRLRGWLDEDREGLRIHRQLTEDAAEWEKTARDVNYLYRGGRLAQAREWATTLDAALNELEQAFLDAGLAQQEDELATAKAVAAREADAARKLRQRAVFLRGALVIAAVLAIVSFLLYGQSSRNADQAIAAKETAVYNQYLATTREAEANNQWQKTFVQSLAALSAITYERDQNPELAILLGVEAAQRNVSNQAGANLLIDNSLRSILQEYAYFQANLPPHNEDVLSLAFSSNGQILASGSYDGPRLWDLRNSVFMPKRWPTEKGGAYALALSPDGQILAISNLNETILWNIGNSENEPVLIAEDSKGASSLAFSPDGQQLAGGTGGTIWLWDVSDMAAEPIALKGHEDSVYSLAFSPDGQTLASGSLDDTIRLWDLRNPMSEPKVLTEHTGDVWSVAFSPNGQMLASGSHDGTIRLWPVNNLSATSTVLIEQRASVRSVAFSPDGQTIAGGSIDGVIRLWDASNPTVEQAVLTGQEGGINSVVFLPDGQTLASGSEDGTIRLWDLQNPVIETTVIDYSGEDIKSLAFSPDGQRLAIGSGGAFSDGAIRLWDMENRDFQLIMENDEIVITSVAFSSDGQTLASGSTNQMVYLWNVDNPKVEPVLLTEHESSVLSEAFSPDGQMLASGSYDGTILLWNVGDPAAKPIALTGHEDVVHALMFSPNGQMLASGSYDGTIRLWDMNNLTAIPTVLDGDSGPFWSIAFSPDGQLLAGGSGGSSISEKSIHLWNMSDLSAESVVLTGHEGWVSSVVFSPDGQTLASGGGYDGTIRLWDIRNPTVEPVVLTGHEEGITSVVFSPDGQTLASASYDRTIRFWPTLERLVAFGCQRVGRNLNWEEWQRYLPGEPYRQTCPHLPRHPSVPPEG